MEIGEDEFDAPFLDIEDLVPMVEKAHLELELLPFGEVAGGLGRFGAEKGHEGKDPLVDADHDLLIELAALGKGRCIAKIIDIEKFCSPFGRGSDDVGGEIFDGLHRVVHVEAIGVGDLRLDFEDGLDLPVAECDGAMVEDELEIGVDFGLVILDRGDFADRVFHRDLRLDDLDFEGRCGGDNPPSIDRIEPGWRSETFFSSSLFSMTI